MKVNNRKYQYIALLLPVMTLAGCMDDPLMSVDPVGNPDAITFSANMVDAPLQGMTRGNGTKPLYEPLVLTGDVDAAPLYLHTFETNRIGYRPGDTEVAETRGYQVKNEVDLLSRHEKFKVLGNKTKDGSNYLGWVDTHIASSGDNVWYTDRTEYWPAAENISFYAVSPSIEFENLIGLSTSDGVITFDYQARKGVTGSNKDAEAQEDLLLATYECNKATHGGQAPLKFQHALSAVKFAVRDVIGGEVVNIKIAGVKSAGHCRLEKNTEGKYQFTWSAQTGEETYSQDFNYAIDDDRNVSVNDADHDLELYETMPEKTFMMIPQAIPDDAYIEVTLERSDNMVAAGAQRTITVRGRIKDNEVREWKPGHEYVYTISTSKDNWTYVLEVYGNHDSGTGNHGSPDDAGLLKGNQIYVYSPMDVRHETYRNNAYFGVRSYRFRANDPTVMEKLPWSATHGGTKQYRVRGTDDVEYTDVAYKRTLGAEDWIPESTLNGNGSYDVVGETSHLGFAEHHVATDWPGDIWMQNQDVYTGNSEENPWDMSTFGGSTDKRSTANTYVIDRGGWYAIPLVYGNAISGGEVNRKAFEYPGNGDAYNLQSLVDHNNRPVTSPWITDAYDADLSADLIWTDVYGVFDGYRIGLVGDKPALIFHAERSNMQQGNAIIALYSGSTVVWSWQIWITEHWLDPATGKPECFSDTPFVFEKSEKSGWRKRGDVRIDNKDVEGSRGYMISPYNIGWCDPKNVDYLKRKGTMSFVQYLPDGNTATSKTASLPIVQDGSIQEYKYGNNTYYQWGRKDPSIGFVDHEQTMKICYGPKKFRGSHTTASMSESIKNPDTFYENDAWDADWCAEQRINYWNNTYPEGQSYPADDSGRINKYTHTVKTIYDPSPAGYMIPPSYMMRMIGKSDLPAENDVPGPSYRNTASNNTTIDHLNGYPTSDWYTIMIDSRYKEPTNYNGEPPYVQHPSTMEENLIWLTSTGNRWRGTYSKNFNPQIVYLWSSTATNGHTDIGNVNNGTYSLKMSYGMALGNDATSKKYVVCSYFIGAKAFARPIRPIREL